MPGAPLAHAALALALSAAKIAIVSSSNEASGQPTLRYPERDAEKMAAVLGELGSFDDGNLWMLRRASAPALRQALDRAEAIAAREPGSSILVYYSGHADADGLLLGGDRFTYRELRERLARSQAAVRVAVLDACNSGGATHPKGGRPGNGPAITPPDPVRVRGAAILAASTGEEPAQESSELGGSYFTHYFVSALRGAGDRDGNGAVTLDEAYGYAYGRTVAATLPTLWGPQHPAYDVQLAGVGELQLTTLQRGHQGLAFAPGAAGDAGADGPYTVLDGARDVVAELRPDARRTVRIAVPPGRYWVTLRSGGRLLASDVTVRPAEDTVVDRAQLREVSPALAMAKGAGPPPPRAGVFVDYALAGRGSSGLGISPELGVTFRHDWGRWSFAPRASYGRTEPDALGISFGLRRWTAAVYLFRAVFVGPLDIQVGARASASYVQETTPGGDQYSAWVPGVAAALAIQVPLGRWLALRSVWDAGPEWVPVDGGVDTRTTLRASLGAGGTW